MTVDRPPRPRHDALRAARRRRLLRAATSVALVFAGAAVSLALLGNPSLATVTFWLALFVAVTAFVALQREYPR